MIKLTSPDIRPEDIQRAVAVLESGNLVQGATVEAFEHALCAFTGIEHCAVVSSGTSALHLAVLALGIGRGDGVLVPAFTFPAPANVVEAAGARTILCDVDPTTYVATPESVAAALEASRDLNVRAIILVHEFGYPAQVRAIAELAARRGIKLIEDAACALGTVADGHHPGYFGNIACLSFHPRKALTTGEGGALLSREEEIIATTKKLRNHGMGMQDGGIDFFAAGLNYRMTEFQAALGLSQIGRFMQELDRRRSLAAKYRKLLAKRSLMVLPSDNAGHSWQTFMVVLDDTIERHEVIDRLRAKGIQSNLGAQALHRLAYFREKYAYRVESFPVARRLYDAGLALPFYGGLESKDVETVVHSLSSVLAEASA